MLSKKQILKSSCCLLLLLMVSPLQLCNAFSGPSCHEGQCMNVKMSCSEHHEPSRRTFLSQAATGAFLAWGVLPGTAQAKDELFKKNPLTNPVLEQVRIWEQAEADELRYGGELEMGDAGNKGQVDAYPKLLVPILQMSSQLSKVNNLVHENNEASWRKAQQIVSSPQYDKVNFKKTFNKFSDNIYYSDPDRANLYLGGGATPKNEQSIAYLMRNDILTNVEALRAELDYLLKDSTSAQEKSETDDLYLYAKTAKDAMQQYIDLVPPNEVKVARELIAANSSGVQ